MANVLLVEDQSLQVGLIRAFLEGRHSVVGWAQTADAAVEQIRERRPDAVVMDLNLAAGNGIDATAAIKAEDPAIKVVVSTVNVTEEMKRRALEAGADAYLTKPYGREELCDTLDRLCAEDVDGFEDREE